MGKKLPDFSVVLNFITRKVCVECGTENTLKFVLAIIVKLLINRCILYNLFFLDFKWTYLKLI